MLMLTNHQTHNNQAHVFMEARLSAQQAELERHQRETTALNTQLRTLLDKVCWLGVA